MNKDQIGVIVGVVIIGVAFYFSFIKSSDYSNDNSAEKYYDCVNFAQTEREQRMCVDRYGYPAYRACKELVESGDGTKSQKQNAIKNCERFIK